MEFEGKHGLRSVEHFFLEVPIFLGNSSGVLEEARFTVYNTSGDVSNDYVELLISISRNPS